MIDIFFLAKEKW